ncbi:26S proteasome non-ATPase regulatory subunit 9-like isoform X2 [Varroa jacobsoni]|uniref:26S proteasome non-ATPase regulatory subunit 9 n=1 Tax=Varroa destructor TaxID=109461 RepID=A0A7M7KBB3_VARDE|nr:26S proteasome non-ATPase regulatory subunit 9-like isoform X2 [Varroa destructor]XP_022685993.1 26S proteasome non-ATPase regulatory subunit 9-like isoform X2 [Varroa jacobsoni]
MATEALQMIDHELNVRNLMVVKVNIEQKINILGGVLSTNGVGMTEPLVDRDGYPRNDIDVYQVRKARHDIICLQNDLKEVTRKIEEGLHRLHAERAESGATSTSETDAETRRLKAFARISSVERGSPADQAGLRSEDLITNFGSIHIDNFNGMMSIAGLVQNSIGKALKIRLLRGLSLAQYDILLVPKSWSGQGVLGCKIVPL